MNSLQGQKAELTSSVLSQSQTLNRQLSSPKTSTAKKQEIEATKTEATGNLLPVSKTPKIFTPEFPDEALHIHDTINGICFALLCFVLYFFRKTAVLQIQEPSSNFTKLMMEMAYNPSLVPVDLYESSEVVEEEEEEPEKEEKDKDNDLLEIKSGLHAQILSESRETFYMFFMCSI